MSISENSKFNDIRMEDGFRGISFSNYKLTEVRKQLIKHINVGKLEESCYWSAEMVASGHYAELWECIFEFIGKYIHNGNPKIPIYLVKRYETFRNIMNQRHYNYVLDLRNNFTIRQIFAEIVTILCLSVKKPAFETVKLLKEEEDDYTLFTSGTMAMQINLPLDIWGKAVRNYQASVLDAENAKHVVFCPERTIEGNALEELYSNPQIIGSESSIARGKVRKVFEQLKDIRNYGALIVVSHRPSTLKYCDRVFSLQQGRLSSLTK